MNTVTETDTRTCALCAADGKTTPIDPSYRGWKDAPLECAEHVKLQVEAQRAGSYKLAQERRDLLQATSIAVADELAKLTKTVWRVEMQDTDFYDGPRMTIRDNHRQLVIHQLNGACTPHTQRGRWKIDGEFSKELLPYERHHLSDNRPKLDITCAQDKPPAQIARDIFRRLIPEYDAELARRQEIHQETKKRHNGVQDAARRLIAASDNKLVLKDESRGIFDGPSTAAKLSCWEGKSGLDVNVELNSEYVYSLNFRWISFEQAEAILRALIATPKNQE